MRQIQLFVQDSELGAGTRGASLGPGAVQAVSRTRKNELFAKHHPTRIFTNNRALDFPNKYPAGNFIEAIADSFSAMVDQASMLLNDGSFKIFLSGDHSVAGATVASLKKKNPDKRIGVVWIDAHADIHTPFTSPSGNIHGMPVAMSMGIDNEDCANKTPSEETISYWNSLKNLGGVSPKFSPEDLIYVAVRDTEQQEEAIMEKLGIPNLTVNHVRRHGTEWALSEIKKRMEGVDLIYVSFDVDSMDPEYTSKGTGTPVENGLTPIEAQELLLGIAKWEKTEAIEFVEINPCLDNKINKMAEVSFDLLLDLTNTIEQNA